MSIRKLAKAAGVSPATASVAMRGGAGISAETSAHVRATAERLGVKPGKPGRPRRRPGTPKSARQHKRLALVAWKLPTAWLASPVYMAVIRGVEKGAAQHDKALILRHILPEDTPAPNVLSNSVDGIILFGDPTPADTAMFGDLPTVRVMGAPSTSADPKDHITYNDQSIGILAADYLSGRGHRQVAYLGTASRLFTRGAEFLRQFNESGGHAEFLDSPEPLLLDGKDIQYPNTAVLNDMVNQLISLSPCPTALFVGADAVTQGLYPILIARGIHPGRDLEIISCNNESILLNGLASRPATIDIHAEEIGSRAVAQLLDRIDNPDSPRVTLALEPELILGTNNP